MTNGLVSVVVDGKVVCKAVCGCEGYNANKLAELIRTGQLTSALEIEGACVLMGFGCSDCRVVMDDAETIVCACPEDLSPLYKLKFTDPRFNPRWESGICGRTVVVEFPSRP